MNSGDSAFSHPPCCCLLHVTEVPRLPTLTPCPQSSRIDLLSSRSSVLHRSPACPELEWLPVQSLPPAQWSSTRGNLGSMETFGCHDSGGGPGISWAEVSHAATHPTVYHMAPQTKTEVKSPWCHRSQPHGQRRLRSRDRKVESALPAATLTPWCPAGYFVLCESRASWSVKWTCYEQTRKYYIYEALAQL